MENQFHAHDFLETLQEYPDGCDIVSLQTIVSEKFGSDARFVNCSEMKFTIDELLLFLERKGKIIVEGDVVKLNAARMCKH